MRIDLLTSNDTQPRGVAGAMSLWRVGAILDATAVRDATSGQLWLEVDNRRLPARIASGDNEGPADGEQLKLRVLRESPVLALESLERSERADVTGAALRRNLPQQTLPTPLLANLAWLSRNNAAGLPAGVAAAAEQLWRTLPTSAALTDPASLMDALGQAGVFLEASLARSQSATATAATLARDFKARLLQLKQELSAAGTRATANADRNGASGPLPVLRGPLTAVSAAPATLAVIDDANMQLQELAQQTHGCLARVNSTQLINVEAAQSAAMACLIELPFRHEDRADLLRFRIEREGQDQAGEEPGWTVEAALDLGINGSLHARVSLQGRRLAVQLRSESPLLVDLLNQHAHGLTAALRAEGFLIDGIACLHGAPVRDPGEHALRLLDLHA